MDDIRFKLEGKVEKLVHANKRLLLIIDEVKTKAKGHGLNLSELDHVQASDFLTTLDDIPPPTTHHVSPSPARGSSRNPSSPRGNSIEGSLQRQRRRDSVEQERVEPVPEDEEIDSEIQVASTRRSSPGAPLRNSKSKSSSSSGRKKSPSPSPFRRFIGRRAKSPGRSLSKDLATPPQPPSSTATTGANSKPSSTRNRRKMFKIMGYSSASQDDVSPKVPHPPPHRDSEETDPPSPGKKRRASLSALASRSAKPTTPSENQGDDYNQSPPEPDDCERPAIPPTAAERRGAAAQKTAARMRAVRDNNSRGTWGFSV